MDKWRRGFPVLPGRYVCVVDDPHQGVVTMHILINSHHDALACSGGNKTLIGRQTIRAYKRDERREGNEPDTGRYSN